MTISKYLARLLRWPSRHAWAYRSDARAAIRTCSICGRTERGEPEAWGAVWDVTHQGDPSKHPRGR